MRRSSQLRRLAKWVGVAICTLIAVVWVIGGWWYAYYAIRPEITLHIDSGCVSYIQIARIPTYRRKRDRNLAQFEIAFSPFPTPKWKWTPKYLASKGNRLLTLPCWIPLLFVGLPTAILFWRDRRRRIPAAHCQKCGYDLTGNTSGRCPECGAAVKGNSDAHS